MKLSKKKQRVKEHLDKIQDFLDYYTGGNNPLKAEFRELRETFEELTLEQKEHNKRFAKKLRWIWDNEEPTKED